MQLPSDGVLKFDVIRFGSPDDALLRRCIQSAPLIQVVKVLLHDDIATTRKWRVFRLDESRLRQTSASRVFGAVDKAQKVSGVKISKAMDFIGDRYGVPQASRMSRSSSKHMSARSARMWNNKSPGVATATCTGPRISAKGRSCAGRRDCPNRSQAALPMATLQERRPCKSRNPTVRTSPPISAITLRTLWIASGALPIDETRNTAARERGAIMLCGSIGTRSEESTIGTVLDVNLLNIMVRPRGLEPPRVAPLAPQASASTNSAMAALWAWMRAKPGA